MIVGSVLLTTVGLLCVYRYYTMQGRRRVLFEAFC
jgi:hypothetical protein